MTINKNETILMPMLPLRGMIVFPHTVLPLLVGRKKSIIALNKSIELYDNKIFLVTQKNKEENDPSPENIYKVGTIANVIKVIDADEDETIKVIVEGVKRAHILNYTDKDDYYEVELEFNEDKSNDELKEKAYMVSLLTRFNRYAQFKDNISSEIIMSIKSVKQATKLVDILIANLDVLLEDKQHILEIFDIIERMDALLKLIQSEIEILKLGRKIDEGVKEKIAENRKRFVLNQKIKVIKEELGETKDYNDSLNKLRDQIINKHLPLDVEDRSLEEFNKLTFMNPSSPEANVIKNYLDWIIKLPWNDSSKERKDLKEATKILNKDHYGIEDVKERILEFLAVRILTDSAKGSILCFAGPPGVGKTSLVNSIAKATNREYIRLALGGIKDEAEIRGHRKTYIGAMPGNIIQSLKRVKTNNPVFLLDELDKLSVGMNGDPASALLEVLDPEQNSGFMDHYINLEFDLSKVFFIATANNLQNIPNVLRDRLEIISLSGYTYEEKYEIAKRYLVKKAQKANGLANYKIKITDGTLKSIIHLYTREAGVRSLEREISKIFRKIAKKILLNKLSQDELIRVTQTNLKDYLGIEKFSFETKEKEAIIGVVSGLAWTSVGGEILKIEVMVVPGKGKIEITGKLGEVMVESAKAALTYVRSKAKEFNLPDGFYEKNDIHIHVPEGAIPKDGPSAGITISTALLSAFTQRKVRNDIAMTGEITLRGFVSPIGGLKEKLLAAVRAGITTVIIPFDNKKDLAEISPLVLSKLEIIPVKNVKEVWDIAFS